jgi:hypothetical protein
LTISVKSFVDIFPQGGDGARTFKETASERGISDEEPGIAVVQRLSYNH